MYTYIYIYIILFCSRTNSQYTKKNNIKEETARRTQFIALDPQAQEQKRPYK